MKGFNNLFYCAGYVHPHEGRQVWNGNTCRFICNKVLRGPSPWAQWGRPHGENVQKMDHLFCDIFGKMSRMCPKMPGITFWDICTPTEPNLAFEKNRIFGPPQPRYSRYSKVRPKSTRPKKSPPEKSSPPPPEFSPFFPAGFFTCGVFWAVSGAGERSPGEEETF